MLFRKLQNQQDMLVTDWYSFHSNCIYLDIVSYSYKLIYDDKCFEEEKCKTKSSVIIFLDSLAMQRS